MPSARLAYMNAVVLLLSMRKKISSISAFLYYKWTLMGWYQNLIVFNKTGNLTKDGMEIFDVG